MKTHIILALIILWFLVGCSSSKVESVKPTTTDDIVTPHEASTIIEPGDIYDEDALINMQNHIDNGVQSYYKWKGHVPASYNELISSGLLFSTPRCPYNDELYSVGDSTGVETPSIFTYYPLSEKTYGYELIVMKNGELSKFVYNMDRSDSWENDALIKGTANYADVKIESLLVYIPNILKQYYKKNGTLPSTPEDLFNDSGIVQAGWQTAPGDFNNTYFEFGVDNEHERYYLKYKYTFGKNGHCFSWHADSLAPEASFMSPEEIDSMLYRFKFDDVPPLDTLIMQKWFDLDSIEEFYNIIE